MIAFFTRYVRAVAASFILAVGVVIALANSVTGCSLFTTQNAKTALTLTEIACVIANAELADQTVAQVCGVADVLIPDLQKILTEQRVQLAKAKAQERMMSCGPDAAADAAK